MNSLYIKDFRFGLDTRKSELTQKPGSLEVLNNGFINQGGEIENRKAFVRTARIANTFGLQSTSAGLYTFGSIEAPVAHTAPGLNIGTGPIPIYVLYQRLQHPSVLDGMSESVPALSKVEYSTSFGGLAFVVAKFDDGNTFAYYNGDVADDFVEGLVLPYLVGRTDRLAAHLLRIINLTSGYVAALSTTSISGCANNGSGLIRVTLVSTSYYATGDRVTITGVVGTTEANADWTVTRISNSIMDLQGSTYANAYVSGGTITWKHVLDIDGGVGIDYSIAATEDSVAGTIAGPTNTVTHTQTVIGQSAIGSFVITGGRDNGVTPTASTGTVVSTATNATAGTYVQIGKKKYTFRATLSVEGDVLIGADAAASLVNLQRAILHTGTPVTDYLCAFRHPWVKDATIAALTLTVTLYKGSYGGTTQLLNTVVTWSVTAFTASVGNCIANVLVVSTAGVETELLSTAIRFTTNASTTAALVKDEINATAANGYSAEVNENIVTIYSSTSLSPQPNGYVVRVVAGGEALVGECMFYFTQLVNPFTINSILVDGLDLLPAAQAFNNNGSGSTNPDVNTLPEFYVDLVTKINLRSGITGINASSTGAAIKLSSLSTRSDDQAISVYVTPLNLTSVGIVFATPPPLALPLSVVLPTEVFTTASNGRSPTAAFQSLFKMPVLSYTFDPTVSGGNGVYLYEWYSSYPGTESRTVPVVYVGYSSGREYTVALGDQPALLALGPITVRRPTLSLTPGNVEYYSSGTGDYLDISPVTHDYVVRCRVSDSFGNVAISNECRVVFEYI